jgi:hypothetical protein
LICSVFIKLPLLTRGCAGRDDSKDVALDLDMNDKEKAESSVHPEDRVSNLVHAAGVDHLQERIEERFDSLYERNAMLA